MLFARVFTLIRALARTRPMVRSRVPPISLACAPKMCSTTGRQCMPLHVRDGRTRTVDFVRLARPLTGRAFSKCPGGAIALSVNVAFQLPVAQPGLHFFGPIDRTRPHAEAGSALHQQLINRLAVMHSGIADVTAADQLVRAVHILVVLVAVMALAVLARRENLPPD